MVYIEFNFIFLRSRKNQFNYKLYHGKYRKFKKDRFQRDAS